VSKEMGSGKYSALIGQGRIGALPSQGATPRGLPLMVRVAALAAHQRILLAASQGQGPVDPVLSRTHRHLLRVSMLQEKESSFLFVSQKVREQEARKFDECRDNLQLD